MCSRGLGRGSTGGMVRAGLPTSPPLPRGDFSSRWKFFENLFRVGSAVVEPYINYYKNLLPSTKYRRNLGSKIRWVDRLFLNIIIGQADRWMVEGYVQLGPRGLWGETRQNISFHSFSGLSWFKWGVLVKISQTRSPPPFPFPRRRRKFNIRKEQILCVYICLYQLQWKHLCDKLVLDFAFPIPDVFQLSPRGGCIYILKVLIRENW